MKKKKQLSERLPASTFILLAGLISALASGTGALLNGLTIEIISLNFYWYLFVLSTMLPTILIIIGQAFLFKYQFGWSAIKWILAGFVAVAVMISWNFAQSILLAYISALSFSWFLRRIPIAILALSQFVVLRQYVSKAWLWIVAMIGLSVVNLPLFSLINRMSVDIGVGYTVIGTTIVLSLLSGIQGTILGMVLTWLVRMTVRDDMQEIQETHEDNLYPHLMDSDVQDNNSGEEVSANLHENIKS